ncbi:crossover junction endodeoxyribonuclease RuvC [Desulfovibrio inopinatus]|uniref:crossover junction endodeoxyribonuclease RuvC n=1 Tax=Desulfovibrio inopinatus TaxID=102109 RepID=UPI000415B997|nr:crossover junction endodeoxyribonuclease RuvC [Desulfovibrio inopinatus]
MTAPRPGNGVVVLGLDPGSRVMGYGLVRETSGVLSFVDAGCLRIGAEPDFAVRLGRIFTHVRDLIAREQPDAAAVENVFLAKNTASALKLGQARGAALAACAVANVPVHGYDPTVIKKSLVGVGRAEKSQVAFMVARLLGHKKTLAADASDALAAAVCHLNHHRMRMLSRLK